MRKRSNKKIYIIPQHKRTQSDYFKRNRVNFHRKEISGRQLGYMNLVKREKIQLKSNIIQLKQTLRKSYQKQRRINKQRFHSTSGFVEKMDKLKALQHVYKHQSPNNKQRMIRPQVIKNIRISLQKPRQKVQQKKFYLPERRKYQNFKNKSHIKLKTKQEKKYQYKQMQIKSVDKGKQKKQQIIQNNYFYTPKNKITVLNVNFYVNQNSLSKSQNMKQHKQTKSEVVHHKNFPENKFTGQKNIREFNFSGQNLRKKIVQTFKPKILDNLSSKMLPQQVKLRTYNRYQGVMKASLTPRNYFNTSQQNSTRQIKRTRVKSSKQLKLTSLVRPSSQNPLQNAMISSDQSLKRPTHHKNVKSLNNLPNKPIPQNNYSSERYLKSESCHQLLSKFSKKQKNLIKKVKQSYLENGVPPETSLDFYRPVKLLGKGSFGKVFQGVEILTDKMVAIKCIDQEYMKNDFSRMKIMQEVLILKKLVHVNIIRLLEVFENQENFFMVMEHSSSGDLLTRIKDHGRMSEGKAKSILKQIAEGIAHCHHNNILHRDIKLDNILIDQNMTAKICDFGVSRFIRTGEVINEQCGTPAYIAPEIITNQGYSGYKSDIWSLGVLLYVMVTGMFPFTADNLPDLNKAICGGKVEYPAHLTEGCRDLIKWLLVINVDQRFDIRKVLKHKWLSWVKFNRQPQHYCNILDVVYYNQEEIIEFLQKDKNKEASKKLKGPVQKRLTEVIDSLKIFGYREKCISRMLIDFIMNHIFALFFILLKEY